MIQDPDQPAWYCARTQTKREHIAAEHLRGLGARGVHHADDPQEPITAPDDHQRLAGIASLRVSVLD